MIRDIVKNLEKGKYLLETINDETYSNKTIAPYYSSIGSHTRHVLDMFNSVFRDLETGCIDLTKRDRNSNIESYTTYGLEYYNSIINKLEEIQVSDLEKVVDVVDDLGGGCCTVKTTLGGIIAQCQSHAIHHFATIGYMLHCLNVCLPIDSFGVNPTTPKEQLVSKSA